MSDINIRPEVVALLTDVNTAGSPDQWTHANGDRLIRAQVELVLSATRPEVQAALDYAERIADYARDHRAALDRVKELTGPYFAHLRPGVPMRDVLPLMKPAERKEAIALMDLLAPDGKLVLPA